MKQIIKKYIREWEMRCYFDGIPDEANERLEELNKVPSYRKICIAIMKNDVCLESLGFTKNKTPIYHSLKKAELIQKGKINIDIQLKLNL